MSKTSIDRLGERLREGPATESDLEALSAYRDTFRAAYLSVASVLRDDLGCDFTGRPAKSTTAIVDKLRREKIRLTQIQDVAGARVLVPDLFSQDDLASRIVKHFPMSTVLDRRAKPSNGYRAVHVVVRLNSLPVEIQIRTQLQHRWAELSERVADTVDESVKYGGGPEYVRTFLRIASAAVASIESRGRQISARQIRVDVHDGQLTSDTEAIALLRADVALQSRNLQDTLDEFAGLVQRIKEL